MAFEDYIREMPKVELHVHLEGAIQPETLLDLARRNQVPLPVDTVEGMRQWYTFTDFAHFVEIYITLSGCIRTPEDLEFIACEFLRGQAAQNIRYSEVTFTPYTHYSRGGKMAFEDQIAALGRARQWAKAEFGIGVGWVLDISRNVRPIEHGLTVAEWAVSAQDRGVVALGLGGPEIGNPPELFEAAFAYARSEGLPGVPHAGETVGAASVWGAVESLQARRIGHGVRCLEDPKLVDLLRDRQIPLEVCPTSNVCLGVTPNLADHPLPRLMEAGLCVTLNSDDPPMFNTSLTEEYLRTARTFGFDAAVMEQFVLTAARVSLLPDADRTALVAELQQEFTQHQPRG